MNEVMLSIRQVLELIGKVKPGEDHDPADAKRVKRALRRAGALHGGGGRGIPCWTTIHELARLGLVREDQADRPLHEAIGELARRVEALRDDLDEVRSDVRLVADVAGEAKAEVLRRRPQETRHRTPGDG